MQSPWNLPGQTVHVWHNKFNLSGTVAFSQADGEATALDLWQPIASLCSAGTSLIGWSYYAPGATVSSLGATYTAGTHAGTRAAYGTPGALASCQLEVCALCRAPVGRNTRGKEVYLRKWVHDVAAESADPNTIGQLVNPATVLGKWNTGSGPHNVVPVDPTGGAQGGPWTVETHLFTHPLRRGPRRKAAKAPSGDLSQILQDLAAARQLLASIPDA